MEERIANTIQAMTDRTRFCVRVYQQVPVAKHVGVLPMNILQLDPSKNLKSADLACAEEFLQQTFPFFSLDIDHSIPKK